MLLSLRKLYAVAALASALAMVPTVAHADTPVTFVNQSGLTLHIYYLVSQANTVSCQSLMYAGTFAPGQQMQVSIPTGHLGWYRFQLDRRDNGCASYNSKFESRIAGVPNGAPQPIFVQ